MISFLLHRQVGPRDGLQFEKQTVSVEDKLAYIDKLVDSGERYIEAGSFVNPAAVPQMMGSNEVAKAIVEKQKTDPRYKNVTFAYLTLNERDAQEALEIIAPQGKRGPIYGELSVVVAASDEFCKANMGVANMEDSFSRRAEPAIAAARQKGVKVRGYVSTAFEGVTKTIDAEGKEAVTKYPVDPEKVADAVERLLADGCYEVAIGDTTGAGTPETVRILLDELKSRGVPMDEIAMHFHDTNRTAMENVKAAMEYGITRFDSSSGGLGGCPFAHSPKGNLDTESLHAYCQEQGIHTDANLDDAVRASHFILGKVDKKSTSPVYKQRAKLLGLAPSNRGIG